MALGVILNVFVGSAMCLFCVLGGLAWYVIFIRRLSHSTRFDYGLSEMEELQIPYSDSAFYLSYFYDVVRAPSLRHGLTRLLTDGRSEAPDTINALQKFNVAPELIVAALHKLMGISESPFTFYIRSLVIFMSAGVAAMAFTAARLSGNAFCSLGACSMFISLCFSESQQAGTRFMGGHSVALREHWGVAALLMQNAVLVAALSTRDRSRLQLVAYMFCTCLFELAWQFAPFVLLLQMLSILGAHTLGCVPRRLMGELACAAACGTLAALVLLFGNKMLLCSPFFALALCMAVLGLARMPAPIARGGVVEAAWVLGLAMAGGAGVHRCFMRLASEQEDAHVLQLLLQKLGVAPPDASFDAFLYLQSPEFGFIGEKFVWEAVYAVALPAACASFLLLALALLRLSFLRWLGLDTTDMASNANASGTRSKGKKPKAVPTNANLAASSDGERDGVPWAAWVVQALFVVALVMLALMVNRLRVLAAPVLCIFSTLVASPLLWSKAVSQNRLVHVVSYLIGSAIIAIPLYSSKALERIHKASHTPADRDMYELVQWANRSLDSSSLLMADMTLAAKIRLISPTVRVGNHPQYESKSSRERNRAYYRTFTCASPQKVHSVLSTYGVTHVVLNANACRARMGKLDAFHEGGDKCGKQSQATLQQETFCWGGFLSQPLMFFKLVFRNPIYTILQLNSSTSSTTARSRSSRTMNDANTWRPWLDNLQDASAARAVARAAIQWPKTYGGTEVAKLMLDRAEALAPNDPIVSLQRGEYHLSVRDRQAAHRKMAAAAKQAGRASVAAGVAEPDDLYQVYMGWKGLLNEQGPREALVTLKRLAKSIRNYLEGSANAFDLCDLASWLRDWGEGLYSKELWQAAKNISWYDQCVQEDWTKWEKKALSSMDMRRAFLKCESYHLGYVGRLSCWIFDRLFR